MKTKTCSAILITTFCLSGLYAADQKGLPPGLQKKDKLPPGWEKKVGNEAPSSASTNVPKSSGTAPSSTTATSAPAPASAKPAPAPTSTKPTVTAAKPRTAKEVKASMDKHMQAINNLDEKAAARKAAFAAIAKETGVSAATVQSQHRDHQNMGTAGLLMANLIAAQTKKPANNYLRQRASGKSWPEIAADNQFDLEKADAALARVEQAMRAAK